MNGLESVFVYVYMYVTHWQQTETEIQTQKNNRTRPQKWSPKTNRSENNVNQQKTQNKKVL